MESDLQKQLESLREQREREENIFCPYCDHKQDIDTMYQHVTYWGESDKEEDQICYCEECGKKFIIEEHVTRTFTSEKMED